MREKNLTALLITAIAFLNVFSIIFSGESQSGAGIVLGKHSGRNAVFTRLRELGYDLEADKLDKVFTRFKEVAEKKKGGLEDDDLEALVADQAGSINELWKLTGLQISTGIAGIPTATVKMIGPDNVERYAAATGTGPVNAIYKAIDTITGVSVDIQTYTMESVSEGIQALATTRVVIAPKEGGPNASESTHAQAGVTVTRKFSGTGSDTDIMTSSTRAYISAINKLLSWKLRRQQLQTEQKDEPNGKAQSNSDNNEDSESVTTNGAREYVGYSP